MRMFHLPSKLEILDPFWDLPQRLLKDWGRTPLFFALLSLHPHLKHAIFCLTAAIYPAGAWAKSPPTYIPPADFDESWQRRSGLSSWAWCASAVLFVRSSDLAFSFLLSKRRSCLVQTCS